MNANELRALQAPIKERYKNEPKAAYITLKAKGNLDTHEYRLQGRNGTRARCCRSASGDRRLRPRTLLRRHAAGGFGRLRRCHHEGGGDRARYSAQIGERFGGRRPRFSRNARRRQRGAGRLRSKSGCASISTPTHRRTSSTSFSSSPSAIAWSIKRSRTDRRST